MVTREVRRVEAKSSEKAGLILRWRGHQGRCRNLVSTILSFFNFAAKPCFNEDLGRCPVCKTVKSTVALLKLGWSGQPLEPPFASRVAKAPLEALESEGTGTCIPASATLPGCVSLGALLHLPETQSSCPDLGR